MITIPPAATLQDPEARKFGEKVRNQLLEWQGRLGPTTEKVMTGSILQSIGIVGHDKQQNLKLFNPNAAAQEAFSDQEVVDALKPRINLVGTFDATAGKAIGHIPSASACRIMLRLRELGIP